MSVVVHSATTNGGSGRLRRRERGLTVKVHFPGDVRILEDDHRDLLFPAVLLAKLFILDFNKFLDFTLRNGNLVVVTLPVPTLVRPVRYGDRETQHREQNRVSERSGHAPRQLYDECKGLLKCKRDGEDEGDEVVIAEISISIDQPDGGGILDRRRLGRADRWPHWKGGGRRNRFSHIRSEDVRVRTGRMVESSLAAGEGATVGKLRER